MDIDRLPEPFHLLPLPPPPHFLSLQLANLYLLRHLHQSSALNLTSDIKATNSLLDSMPIATFISLAKWILTMSDVIDQALLILSP